MAGSRHSNLIEGMHKDTYREGKACTLVGGVVRSRRFDLSNWNLIQVIAFKIT